MQRAQRLPDGSSSAAAVSSFNARPFWRGCCKWRSEPDIALEQGVAGVDIAGDLQIEALAITPAYFLDCLGRLLRARAQPEQHGLAHSSYRSRQTFELALISSARACWSGFSEP